MKSEIPLKERDFQEQDFNFILNSWLVSYRQSDEFKLVNNKQYFDSQPKILINIIQNPNTGIKIFCNKTDDEQIFSYAIYNKNEKLIHFVYTKYNFRRLGLARKIVESIFPKTMWTEIEATFYKSISPFTYNPLKRY